MNSPPKPYDLDDLRRQLRTRRSAYARQQPPAFQPVPTAVDALIRNHAIIGAYYAHAGEIDPSPLVVHLRAMGKTIVFPQFDGRHANMRFAEDKHGTEIGPWRAGQPRIGNRLADPTLILAPLVGFDANGNRLGQGGGHYDRYLAAHPHVRMVGLAWSIQQVDFLDARPWDWPMNAILTEKGLVMVEHPPQGPQP